MTDADHESARRAMRGLLRFLAAGPADGPAAPAGSHATMTLVRAGQTKRRFPAALVRVALTSALADHAAGRYCLTEAGRLWLKRSLVDGDDAYRAQHGQRRTARVDVDGIETAVTIDDAESPMNALARLKDRSGAPFLARDAVRAGERLRADFTRGCLQPRISANWDAGVASRGRRAGGGTAELTEAAMSARRRVERALDAVGPELSGVLVDVCCFLKGLETVERERQWPARSAKLMVKTGLLVLARHYDPPATGKGSAALRHWGADGYRPDGVNRERDKAVS